MLYFVLIAKLDLSAYLDVEIIVRMLLPDRSMVTILCCFYGTNRAAIFHFGV